MSRKSPNLTLSLPTCRHCRRYWRPAQGVVADTAYCKKCSDDRHTLAASHLGLKRLSNADFKGGFLLPRRLRSS